MGSEAALAKTQQTKPKGTASIDYCNVSCLLQERVLTLTVLVVVVLVVLTCAEAAAGGDAKDSKQSKSSAGDKKKASGKKTAAAKAAEAKSNAKTDSKSKSKSPAAKVIKPKPASVKPGLTLEEREKKYASAEPMCLFNVKLGSTKISTLV